MFALTHKHHPYEEYSHHWTFLTPYCRKSAMPLDKWDLGTLFIRGFGHGDRSMDINLLGKSIIFYANKKILDSICKKFLSFKERIYRFYHIEFLPIDSFGFQKEYEDSRGERKKEWKVTQSQFDHYKKAKYYDKVALLREAIHDKSHKHVNSQIKTRKILKTFDVPTLYKVRCVNKAFRDIIDQNYLPSKIKEVKNILDCKKAVQNTLYSDYLTDAPLDQSVKRVAISTLKLLSTFLSPVIVVSSVGAAIGMGVAGNIPLSLGLGLGGGLGGGLATELTGAGILTYNLNKSTDLLKNTLQLASTTEKFKKIEEKDRTLSQLALQLLNDKKVFGGANDWFIVAMNKSYAIWKMNRIMDNLQKDDPDYEVPELECGITKITMKIPASIYHKEAAWDFESLYYSVSISGRDPNNTPANPNHIFLNVEKFNKVQLLKLEQRNTK